MEYKKYKAILFDTRSIQRYIFSGNRLKTNIGASYLVDRVFDDVLLPAVRDVLGADGLDADTWRDNPEPRWDAMETAARVGYIGGGNALLILRAETTEETMRAIVTAFTEQLLVRAPGLRTGAAMGELELGADGSYGGKDLTALVHALKEWQNTVFPCVNLPYTGLTLDCRESDETANAWDESEQRFYSWEVEMKLRADRRREKEAPAEEELRHKLLSEQQADFMEGYAFPMEFSDLGQKTPKNDIAVVHIDGNNMGLKFQACTTLTLRKNLSREIRKKTIAAFNALIEEIILYIEVGVYDDELLVLHDEEGRRLLPIRPLVLGGDDMTFVCPAKVAVSYARSIMEELKEKHGIASCAGITIMNTNDPFFRGYQMAEELCGAAKQRMREYAEEQRVRECLAESDTESCWLDFAILHGEQASSLAQFRAQEYLGACGEMHFGPYRVDADAADEKSIDALLAGVRGMRDLPRNKVKELRRVLAYREHEQRQFMAQLRYLDMRLPDVPAWSAYEDDLWAAGRTPYIDAIELMDYIIVDEEV